jgi:hypothetical protein
MRLPRLGVRSVAGNGSGKGERERGTPAGASPRGRHGQILTRSAAGELEMRAPRRRRCGEERRAVCRRPALWRALRFIALSLDRINAAAQRGEGAAARPLRLREEHHQPCTKLASPPCRRSKPLLPLQACRGPSAGRRRRPRWYLRAAAAAALPGRRSSDGRLIADALLSLRTAGCEGRRAAARAGGEKGSSSPAPL